LTGNKSQAFSNCCLKSITIPRNVQFGDGLALSKIHKISISIESENRRFVIESDCILDSSNSRVSYYFGN
jgi:hypothetical protein